MKDVLDSLRLGALLAGLCAGAPAVRADAPAEPVLPRWERGLAAGGGRVPDYPGADESHNPGIVVPIAVYRGRVLQVDDRGVRGRFVDTPDWEFALSATAAFNARNNTAREGMPELDYLFGIGPQWVYKGLAVRHGGPTLHLKFRALMSTDLRRIDSRGASFDPEVRWRLRGIAGTPATLTLSLQPSWASRPLHRYFYQVDPALATPERPAYVARAGYVGTDATAQLSHRPRPGWSWFVTAGVTSLHGAANAASPLLRSRANLTVGAGVVWTPWRSSEDAGAQ